MFVIAQIDTIFVFKRCTDSDIVKMEEHATMSEKFTKYNFTC